MSYQGISIKEAVHRINAPVNGWFLPSTQRPYVWGSRYEGEIYICKLFDSLLRGYPIGGLLLWQTEQPVAHREFLRDYAAGAIQKTVDEGLFHRQDKSLVYDGQQRLQTLYSALCYTFNGKVLVFDLTFNMDRAGSDLSETGFAFVDKDATLQPAAMRMNVLFAKSGKPRDDDARSAGASHLC